MKIILPAGNDLYNKTGGLKRSILTVLAVLVFGYGAALAFAQVSPSVLYVPLIGITSVPTPLALPGGPGNVTYNYAVKNFLREVDLTQVQVVDDKCSPVIFVQGDDNNDSRLGFSETWRYACTTKLSTTTQSIATATGNANGIAATQNAYATVVVGSNNPPPLVSIVNITKVSYPLTLPSAGGKVTFTYKVNNPGVVPLSNVTVTDDKCSPMSGKLGDTNANNLLDVNEVWIYSCTTTLKETTTSTAHVTAVANGLRAVGYATLTVQVASPVPGLPDQPIQSVPIQPNPNFPETGPIPNLKNILWMVLSGVLAALILVFVLIRKSKPGKTGQKPN
jgi:hypothetical protein